MVDRQQLLGVCIRRARVIPVGDGPVTPAKKAVFLGELAALGYRVNHASDFNDAVLDHHAFIIATLREMRGWPAMSPGLATSLRRFIAIVATASGR